MAKKIVTIEFELDDNTLDRNVPINIWLFQFINRLGYTQKVKSVTIDGKKKVITSNSELKDLPMRAGKDL